MSVPSSLPPEAEIPFLRDTFHRVYLVSPSLLEIERNDTLYHVYVRLPFSGDPPFSLRSYLGDSVASVCRQLKRLHADDDADDDADEWSFGAREYEWEGRRFACAVEAVAYDGETALRLSDVLLNRTGFVALRVGFTEEMTTRNGAVLCRTWRRTRVGICGRSPTRRCFPSFPRFSWAFRASVT